MLVSIERVISNTAKAVNKANALGYVEAFAPPFSTTTALATLRVSEPLPSYWQSNCVISCRLPLLKTVVFKSEKGCPICVDWSIPTHVTASWFATPETLAMVAEMTMISISKTVPSVTTVSEVKVSGAISSWRVAVPGLAGAAGAGGSKLLGGP